MDNLQEIIDSGAWDAIHNARLVAVSADDKGLSVLTLEVQGETVRVVTSFPYRADAWSLRAIGRIGMLKCFGGVGDGPIFIEYPDQTLRRAPELDPTRRRVLHVTGWRCAARPRGFLAPAGLIPGANGDFVDSCTQSITLEVPEELSRLAREHQMTPHALLEGFIADVCGLESFVQRPRADGYSSNGSDERMLAQDWLDRAYGMNRIDITAILDQRMPKRFDAPAVQRPPRQAPMSYGDE